MAPLLIQNGQNRPLFHLFCLTGLIGFLSLSHVDANETDLLSFPTVEVMNRVFTYRTAGEFLKENRPIAGTLSRQKLTTRLHVMTYQVTRAQYQLCVTDGACQKPYEAYARMDGTILDSDWLDPVTGVSYHDTQDFIRWLNRKTGQSWRLPTDLEWAAFAAERYFDDEAGNPDDPLKQTISVPELYKYEADGASLLDDAFYDPIPQKPGHFGANSLGIYDLSGNVSEWTDSCYVRHRFDANGDEIDNIEHCGVKIVEGRQRSYMSTFIRDPSSGECTVAIPTLNLGMRLVRDDQRPLLKRLYDLFGSKGQ